jgi:hypothetical protein
MYSICNGIQKIISKKKRSKPPNQKQMAGFIRLVGYSVGGGFISGGITSLLLRGSAFDRPPMHFGSNPKDTIILAVATGGALFGAGLAVAGGIGIRQMARNIKKMVWSKVDNKVGRQSGQGE